MSTYYMPRRRLAAAVLLLAAAAIASEDANAPAPPPCDVAIVIDRSTVGHAGYTGPTSLSCSSVTDLGDGLCAADRGPDADAPGAQGHAELLLLAPRLSKRPDPDFLLDRLSPSEDTPHARL
jgi:hypothetical protein